MILIASRSARKLVSRDSKTVRNNLWISRSYYHYCYCCSRYCVGRFSHTMRLRLGKIDNKNKQIDEMF